MRRRRKSEPVGGDLSEAKERFYAMAVVAVAAVFVAVYMWSKNNGGFAVGVLIASAIALGVLYAGTERQARPLMIVLKPVLWVIRHLVEFIFFLFSYFAP